MDNIYHTHLHGLGDLLGCEGRLHPAGGGVHPRGHPQVVQRLVLLPDSILSVDSGHLTQKYPSILLKTF